MPTNPYDVERSWPDYFLEHRRRTVEQAGTYRCGELPVWTVYCPGGSLGNSTIIEGDDGLIVYDTGVNLASGTLIATEIKKISDKPVKAVFYSHHHTDHYNGTTAIADPADVASGAVPIYAWANFEEEKRAEFGEIAVRQAMGAAYYGGMLLGPEERHHHGIGLVPRGGETGYLPPTQLLSGDTTLTIAGITLEIFYTGGEAISEFGIHIPAFDLVIIADEFFTGLPNMHTIRGSKPRIPNNYLGALDRVLDIKPQWLLGSHIMPIEGRQNIIDTVTRYRDATQWMWDQSIRLINKGYTPTELQRALKDIPVDVYDPPYTVPMYGTPFTTVPEFFTGWVSWFSGDATDLYPSVPAVKAARFVELMGGADAALDAAKSAHADGDHQFAAELAQLVVRAAPDNDDAKLVKAAALRARGYQEINPIARSWYLTGALELEGSLDLDAVLTQTMHVMGTPTAGEQIRGWRYHVDTDKAAGANLIVGIKLSDTGEDFTVRVRNRVLIVDDGIADDTQAVVSTTADKLTTDTRPETLSGDPSAYASLLGILDLTVTAFNMHQR
jgi:alkyl sulfatase BDS1-like metallo-beta-lactamase superfamily hydrolase